MQLNPDHCYQALLSHDRRFDGRFYVAVRTTHIYCRPVCPVPPPKRQNTEFYACAAAAEQAGFRPCRRCRPELAPGTAAGFDTSMTVTRALRLIANGVLDEDNVGSLSSRLEVGERQLRRLFSRELGASPVAIALTRRVHFARQLLTQTSLPITTIAYSSGFRSLRRFNDAFFRSFRQSPSEVRRQAEPAGAPVVRLQLPFRPPYEWDAMLGFLAARAIPGVEEVKQGAYRRTVSSGDQAGVVTVSRMGDEPFLTVTLTPPQPTALMPTLERLRHLFDCDANPAHLADHFAHIPVLGPLVAARPGLRVPGAWDGFELAVRAILGQQVSVAGARTMAGLLARGYGAVCPTQTGSLTHIFPTPQALRSIDGPSLGLTKTRTRTLEHLAAAVDQGDLVLDGTADAGETRAILLAIPGIGEWTAQYIALRALRLPDAFPAGDLGLRKAWAASQNPVALEQAAEAWRPWRAYAALHLWGTLS